MLLDVMLPRLDEWQVLRRIRQKGKHLPALFLTARDQVEDGVKGLQFGADDYLVKPLAFSERLARMIADMQFLAKADNGLIVPSSENVDLATQVRELFGFYEAFAEERGVGLVLAGAGV